MSAELAAMIESAAAAGCQIHLWPAQSGATGYHATVRGPLGCRNTVREAGSAVTALTKALIEDERLRRDAARRPAAAALVQMDLEDAVRAAAVRDELAELGL